MLKGVNGETHFNSQKIFIGALKQIEYLGTNLSAWGEVVENLMSLIVQEFTPAQTAEFMNAVEVSKLDNFRFPCFGLVLQIDVLFIFILGLY